MLLSSGLRIEMIVRIINFTIIIVFGLLSINSLGQNNKIPSSLDVKKEFNNDSLIHQLATIDHNDQNYRNQMEGIIAKYGGDSKEMRELAKQIKKADSINLYQINAIIDKHGWLGSETIGIDGKTTLFMVIQHADIKPQEKYLPMMRQAVKNGRAKASSLALLEDRIAIRNGREQIYGTQLSWNIKNNTYYVLPLIDPDNVDKRRSEVGLGTLTQYILDCCNLVWDIEKYKNNIIRDTTYPINTNKK